jgi:hypothetical protein
VANAAKESTQREFSHGLLEFRTETQRSGKSVSLDPE